MNTLALRPVDGFDQHAPSMVHLSYSNDNWGCELGRSKSTGFTGLHGSAYLVILEAAVALLETKI